MDHFDRYLEDLKKVEDLNFDNLFLVHTIDNERDSIVVKAQEKLRDYRHHREEKMKTILKFVSVSFMISFVLE